MGITASTKNLFALMEENVMIGGLTEVGRRQVRETDDKTDAAYGLGTVSRNNGAVRSNCHGLRVCWLLQGERWHSKENEGWRTDRREWKPLDR